MEWWDRYLGESPRSRGTTDDWRRHVGDGNFHAALIFNPSIPGEFEKVDAAAHRVSGLYAGTGSADVLADGRTGDRAGRDLYR